MAVKYGDLWGGWCSEIGRGPNGVSLWKFIRRGWDHFFPFLSFKVGNGDRVRFWHNAWCGGLPLKVIYPVLFSIAGDRDASVAALMSFRNGTLHWELTLVGYYEFLHGINLFYQSGWKRGRYPLLAAEIKGKIYCEIILSMFEPHSFGISLERCLESKSASMGSFFLWTTVLGKILTADNLRKRNIVIVSWCCMCKDDGESIDHLFIHCPVVKELWDAVLSLFGVMWVMPRRVRNLIEGWHGSNHHQCIIWNAVPHCLMWSVWRERNSRIFEDSETTIDDLKLRFFRSLFEWMQATNLFSFVSFQDFLDSYNS